MVRELSLGGALRGGIFLGGRGNFLCKWGGIMLGFSLLLIGFGRFWSLVS